MYRPFAPTTTPIQPPIHNDTSIVDTSRSTNFGIRGYIPRYMPHYKRDTRRDTYRGPKSTPNAQERCGSACYRPPQMGQRSVESGTATAAASFTGGALLSLAPLAALAGEAQVPFLPRIFRRPRPPSYRGNSWEGSPKI